jgi:hypothetical protein
MGHGGTAESAHAHLPAAVSWPAACSYRGHCGLAASDVGQRGGVHHCGADIESRALRGRQAGGAPFQQAHVHRELEREGGGGQHVSKQGPAPSKRRSHGRSMGDSWSEHRPGISGEARRPGRIQGAWAACDPPLPARWPAPVTWSRPAARWPRPRCCSWWSRGRRWHMPGHGRCC